jgi:hypothetical protein
VLALSEDEPAAALRDLDTVLEAAPETETDLARARYYRAAALARLDRWDEAKAEFTAVAGGTGKYAVLASRALEARTGSTEREG